MSEKQRRGSPIVTWLTVRILWVIKYRYPVLIGDIQPRCWDLVRQICESEDVRILKGVVGKDHMYIHVKYPPTKSISNLVKRLKGRSSRCLQEEFPGLGRRYFGR